MAIGRGSRYAREEGVAETTRLALERGKRLARAVLGLDVWVRYHRTKAALFFDRDSIAEPFAKRWVDPKRVTHRPRSGYFDRQTSLGNIRGGNWDHSDRRIDDHATYRGLTQRFVEGRPWEETVYVEHNAARIGRGRHKKGCSGVEELLEE